MSAPEPSEPSKATAQSEQQRARELLYAHMFHGAETRVKLIALGIAVVLHLFVLWINLPEFKTIEQKRPENVLVVRKYVPPPPKVERKQIVRQQFTRKVPIPDPTPDEPEPIREPEPEIEPEPIPPDVDVLIGVPEPPPPGGPLLAGAEGVTLPELIQESKIKPDYPELARVARIEGRVILQAIVLRDGSVGELEVLSCNRPGMGFEEAAVEAVSKWRYRPAMQGSRAVDVYFTVRVDFELQ
jgi:protein TonB